MKPLIGLTADQKYLEEHYWHAVEEHYLTAVINAAGGIPVIVPALAERQDQDALLQRLDGLLLTGGVSNFEYRAALLRPAIRAERLQPRSAARCHQFRPDSACYCAGYAAAGYLSRPAGIERGARWHFASTRA
jgi:hypothetical protein